MKLFANGALVTTNISRSVISTETMERRNSLGRSNRRGVNVNVADFHGQTAEVRLWPGERTEAQIRENLFKNLTGKEEGLAGLWSFADGTANDSSPGAHHGRLMGQTKVVEATLPAATTLAPWSRLFVQVTIAAGVPAQNPTVRAEVNGTEVGRADGDTAWVALLTIWTAASTVDLFASTTNDLGGWRSRSRLTPNAPTPGSWAGPRTSRGRRSRWTARHRTPAWWWNWCSRMKRWGAHASRVSNPASRRILVIPILLRLKS